MERIWTDEQTDFLKKNYEYLKTSELLIVLNDKSNDQLRWKAKEFKLKKKVTRSKTNSSFLENFDSPDCCYWWGFITADGCINHRQIILSIHERDKNHLKIFCEKANSTMGFVTRQNSWHKTPYTMVRTVVNDIFFLKRITEKLSIQPKKTYNPFDIDLFLTKERLCYFLSGIIDGDGHILVSKNGYGIKIKVHQNWKENFDKISKKMLEYYNIHSTATINKATGWLTLGIYRKNDVIKLFKLIEGSVPYMERKWSKVQTLSETL